MAGRLRVLVQLEGAPAAWNMAVDEALLRLRSEGLIPDTLRLYTFRPPAVTVGRFQRLASSVDLEAARRMGVDVVRRITGGGSVYHDPSGEVTYSIVVGFDTQPRLRDVVESFRTLCTAVAEALRGMGVPAEYKPVNDVVIGGRKVSGNAQARTGRALLQHGTILYRVNREAMEALLRAPREKLSSHGAARIADRVTSVEEALGRRVNPVEVAVALVDAFRRILGYEAVYVDTLTPRERRLAEQLRAKYESREWLWRR